MNQPSHGWQAQPDADHAIFDADSPAWITSLLLHLAGLVVITLIIIPMTPQEESLTISTPMVEDLKIEQVADHFHFDTEIDKHVGANSADGTEVAREMAPVIAEVSHVPGLELAELDIGNIELLDPFEQATSREWHENMSIKGAAGVGTTGASGAVDRTTHEILLSLEERKTLVVWLFDQSGSLERQRAQIYARLDRIYQELGVIEAAGKAAFAKYEDKPLLSSVVAFGEQVTLRTKQPTDDVDQIKTAVNGIERDNSGIERVFSAVRMTAQRYRPFRSRDPESGEPMRNVMIVIFSDEAGDDQDLLDPTVNLCRRLAMPVYVVGVPAPFGRRETLVKWIDPDPEFNQSPQWGRVTQGPESLRPERIKLHFSGSADDQDRIDSGFGPYALTRLCFETGGIYFAVHPNRNSHRAVRRGDVEASTAHLTHFFDSQTMRKYRPDYVSVEEYNRRMMSTKSRAALVKSSQMSWVTPLGRPQLDFPKRNEADLANRLTEAQKAAAQLEPRMEMLYQILKLGEEDRENETSLRWQAGFDLAMGRVMAVKVRTEAYNAMLAKAKRGMKFEDAKNDTWELKPSEDISIGSQLKNMADKSRMYLNRVKENHPGTPWAMLASRELEEPLGWTWQESYRGVNSPRQQAPNGNNTPPPARDDQKIAIPRPKPTRPLPAL